MHASDRRDVGGTSGRPASRAGVDFLLGNDLAGGRVWVQSPFADANPDVEGAEVPNSVNVITRSIARRAKSSAAPRVNCDKAGPPREESRGGCTSCSGGSAQRSVPLMTRVWAGQYLSRGAGANCNRLEPPLEAHKLVGGVTEG